MSLLSNSTFQFVISNCLVIITIILSVINIWLLVKRSDRLPSYEGISEEHINLIDPEVKLLLTNLHIPFDNARVRRFCFITFKLWNSGKEPITLDDEKRPLIIAFKGIPILAYNKIGTFPEDFDYTLRLDGGKLLLTWPRLEKNESLTLRILVPEYVYSFPDIRIRGRAPQPMMKANNIRWSKEMLVMGIFYLCAAMYMFFTMRSLPPSPLQGLLWLFFASGIFFLGMSWADRKTPPLQYMLPSTWFLLLLMMFIRALPVLIPIGIVALVVYFWFGARILTVLYLLFALTTVSFGAWYMGYSCIIGWLKKKQKKYSALLIGILTGIPLLAIYAMCVSVIVDILKR
jgi:hypothetical protein